LAALAEGEGVSYPANLHHDAGKPVISMNWNLGEEHTGARNLFREALSARNSERFFYPRRDALLRVLSMLLNSQRKGSVIGFSDARTRGSASLPSCGKTGPLNRNDNFPKIRTAPEG
jgi:hypothetical protein